MLKGYQFLKNNMKNLIALTLLLGLFSCQASNSKIDSDTDKTQESQAVEIQDTTITYNIEGLSSEGAEAKTQYRQNKITQSDIEIYGEQGQLHIGYVFSAASINVTEKQYAYSKSLSEVKTDNDMKLMNERKYTMTLDGKVVGSADSTNADIYPIFKKSVPFELK
jgi:hypothetical protein